MAKKLTREGYYDEQERAYTKVGDEDFEVRDVDIGHPPARHSQAQGEEQPRRRFFKSYDNPQMTPSQVRAEQDRINSDPRVQSNGLLLVKKRTLYVAMGVMIALTLIAVVSSIWFNSSFNTFANKDFRTDVKVDGDTIQNNYTHNIDVNPTIDNTHTIVNNITIPMPEGVIRDAVSTALARELRNDSSFANDISDDVVDRMSEEFRRELQNMTQEILRNLSNGNHS